MFELALILVFVYKERYGDISHRHKLQNSQQETTKFNSARLAPYGQCVFYLWH
jgi:hypothetical protein